MKNENEIFGGTEISYVKGKIKVSQYMKILFLKKKLKIVILNVRT